MDGNFGWSLLHLIGKGGSSNVYKAEVRQPINASTQSVPRYVAVKQIETEALNREQVQGIEAEIRMMQSFTHPNIVHYFYAHEQSSRINIVMEYAVYGSLRQFYQREGALSEGETVYCVVDILAGLQYLHAQGFAHRDIKCANCLLFPQNRVKLADFGASKRFESESIVSGLKGTPNWMAPETIRGDCNGSAWMRADIWSLGCSMVEMLTAQMPYAEYENPLTAMYKIAGGEPPRAHRPLSAPLQQLLLLCCAPDADMRPPASDLQAYVQTRFDLAALPSPSRLFRVELPAQRDAADTADVADELHSGEASISSVASHDSLEIEEVPEDLDGAPTPALRPLYLETQASAEHAVLSREGTALVHPLAATGGLDGVEAEGEQEEVEDVEIYEPDFHDSDHEGDGHGQREDGDEDKGLIALPPSSPLPARPSAPLSGDQLQSLQPHAAHAHAQNSKVVSKSLPSIWGGAKKPLRRDARGEGAQAQEGRAGAVDGGVVANSGYINSNVARGRGGGRGAAQGRGRGKGRETLQKRGAGQSKVAPSALLKSVISGGAKAHGQQGAAGPTGTLRSYSAGVYHSQRGAAGSAKGASGTLKLPGVQSSAKLNNAPQEAEVRYVQSAPPSMSRSFALPPLRQPKAK